MPTQQWALQDAKARLSELVKRAQKNGPQYITVRGDAAVVVISTKKYQTLITANISLVNFFRQSPLVGLNLKLERDKSLPRDVDL